MVNGDSSNIHRCKRCGKELRETPIWNAPVPVELILEIIPRNMPIMALEHFVRHFACPEGHAGAIMAPALGSRDEKVRKANDLVVN